MTPDQDQHDIHDVGQSDDAIIGVALRWSIVAIVGIAVVVGGILFILREPEVVEVLKDKDLNVVDALTRDDVELPTIPFADITTQAGVAFTHVSGANGEKLLPETMGGGAAFFDWDRDGDQDLLFVNGAHWSHSAQFESTQTVWLYENTDGSGTFRNISDTVGLTARDRYGFGPAIADYDNDGDADLFIACLGENMLLRNDGGNFVDVSRDAGIAGDERWSSSAGWFDADNDGDLDLAICNYVAWSRDLDIENAFSLNGEDRAYGPPTDFPGTHCQLYRNNGDGTFADVSAEAGIEVTNPLSGEPVGKALALRPADIDRDGWMDLLVANDTVQNFFFHNQGDGTFVERGDPSGVAFGNDGNATGAMGIDTGYFRHDESLAVAIGNFAKEMTSFYVSQPGNPLFFSDEAIVEGIGSPSRIKLSFGVVFFDADLDGWDDLLQANGHLEETIQEVYSSQRYRQPAQLFWNAGPDARACFAELDATRVADLATPIVGRGAAYADIDGDGDLDVLLTQTGGPTFLLRNDQATDHHWLRVSLQGTTSNRDAIGAEIEVIAGGATYRKTVMPTRSYISQVERPMTIGLGQTASIDAITVRWPSGIEQTVEPEGVDTMMVIVEPDAA
ncbi:MAG: CRTAC1 family protein [Planctomycetota bacterium]